MVILLVVEGHLGDLNGMVVYAQGDTVMMVQGKFHSTLEKLLNLVDSSVTGVKERAFESIPPKQSLSS